MKTLYMVNPKVERGTPLFTFTSIEELEWYVTWKLSCSTKEYHAMMDCFLNDKPYREEVYPNIQYEIRPGE